MPYCVSTQAVGPRERYSFWRDAVCNSYVNLDVHSPHPDRFTGEIILYDLPTMTASFVSGSQQRVRRDKRHISMSTEESFLISLQLKNTGVIKQRGRLAYLNKGDFALYNSSEPYSINLPDDFSQLVMHMPRNHLLERLPNADLLTATAVSAQSDIGSVINTSVSQLVAAIDQSSGVVQQCLQDTIVDLFATGLATLKDADADLSSSERQQFLRAQTFIGQHLKNPELCRYVLADHLGVSVRRLSEIFQAQGQSVASAIRDLRLQRIAADLIDARLSSTAISDIAMKWGINNLQNFPRMFRNKFGLSPSEYRKENRTRSLHDSQTL